MKKLTCLIACLATGCVPFHQGNRDYQVVLGFGLMSVEHTNACDVARTQALGLHTGDGRLNLGLCNVTTTRVPTNSNVIIEIKK